MPEGNWPFDEGSAALSGLFGLIRELRRSDVLSAEQVTAIIDGVAKATPEAGRAGVRAAFTKFTDS